MEVLLSLGLMLLVLTVAYSCLMLFQNVTVAGRASAERAQLARAIERRMTSDIRCVLFREQEPVVEEEVVEEEEEEGESNAGLATMNEGVGAADDPGGTTDPESGTGAGGSTESSQTSSSSSSSASSSSQTTTESTTSTPSAAYASQSMGVFGNATTLVLHVSKPSRESAQATDPMNATTTGTMNSGVSGSATMTGSGMMSRGSSATTGMAARPIGRSSDLRSISYFLAVAGGGGLQGAVGNTATGGTALFTTEQGAQGLARLDGDRLMIEQADAAGNHELLAQQAEVLAPEVTQLQFRYFDGVAWVTTWDSAAMNTLPRAIEVTLRIDVENTAQAASTDGSSISSTETAASGELYRFVVSLPLSDPTLGMAL